MRVKAKRAGWDEQLSEEQLLDLDPIEYDSLDLEGELTKIEVPERNLTIYMVGGQNADPKTIEVIEEAAGEPTSTPE